MKTRVPKAGRNDPCPCGSQRKYKQCCEPDARRSTLRQRLVIGAIAAVLLGGLIFSFATRTEPSGPQTGIWSAEHGHYH